MRILFDLGHPGHVHLFKNVIKELLNRDHNIFVVIRERENTVKPLVENMGVKYFELYPNAKGIIPKAITMIKNDLSLLKISRKIQPDFFLSMTSPYSAQVSKIVGKPHITFADTEDAKLILRLTIPFTEVVITEDSYLGKIPPKKHIPLHTWRPLAYLHPNYFKPDEKVLDMLNLSKNDKFFIMRFSAWDASHDWRVKREIFWEDRFKVVKMLEKEGYVFISSEDTLPKKLRKYELKLNPEYFHDVLYFSSGYIGEGHMTAREAVALEKPSILISPRGKIESVIKSLWKKGYVHIFDNYKELLNISAEEFLKDTKNKIEKEISEMVDINKFFVYLIENYPKSVNEFQKDGNSMTVKFKFGE